MPTVWFSLKKSLQCKSEPSDVVDPKARIPTPPSHHLSSILTKKAPRSGCSRSIANLKDVVIHGSKRHLDRPANCSPRSIGSSEFCNPIMHEVILSSNSKCELKITGFGHGHGHGHGHGDENEEGEEKVVGWTLKPGTPGPSPLLTSSSTMRKSPLFGAYSAPAMRKSSLFVGSSLSSAIPKGHHISCTTTARAGSRDDGVSCHRCGEQFAKWEALEAHHLSKHAVTELGEGDSSRKIVEIICRTSWLKSDNYFGRIQRVLKVHNTQKTLAWFEDYREAVKLKASKLSKKHPRCLADGNELLRFYGTTIACSLGMQGSSSLCASEKCNVCRIIRHGFSINKGKIGVFTTSTSGRAFETIQVYVEDNPTVRKALMVCRVIAGRVRKPLENFHELAGQSGFDSLAGKVGLYSNIEELYLLNPRALLPCFVVICKT